MTPAEYLKSLKCVQLETVLEADIDAHYDSGEVYEGPIQLLVSEYSEMAEFAKRVVDALPELEVNERVMVTIGIATALGIICRRAEIDAMPDVV